MAGEKEPKSYYIGKEEMEASLEKLEKDLKQTVRERDKALKKLNRLNQQLFEKESEYSQKMVKDSKIIKGLRDSNENLRAHIGHLNADLELVGLKNEVASLKSTVDGKNVELSKLQSAEKEFKEHLERDLASVREENKQLKKSVKKGNAKLDFTCVWPCFSFRFVPSSVASHVDPVVAAATKPPDSGVPPAAAYWEAAAAYSDPRGDVEPLWDEIFPKHDSQDSCSIL